MHIDSSETISRLTELDRQRERTKLAADALREANRWSTLVNSRKVLMEGDNVEQLYQLILDMEQSIAYMESIPDFEDRLALLNSTKDRLEALLAPQFMELLDTHGVSADSDDMSRLDALRRLIAIFVAVRRSDVAVRYYTSWFSGRLKSLWGLPSDSSGILLSSVDEFKPAPLLRRVVDFFQSVIHQIDDQVEFVLFHPFLVIKSFLWWTLRLQLFPEVAPLPLLRGFVAALSDVSAEVAKSFDRCQTASSADHALKLSRDYLEVRHACLLLTILSRCLCATRTLPNQAGFRAGRGCMDQIFTLRPILESRHSYQQPTAICFFDFAAAFDSVHCESLWRTIALDGLPSKIIAMIKAYFSSTTARVLVHSNFSQEFDIRSGVRQGCILLPILFNYAIDWILGKALHEEDGVELAPGRRLADLDCANDIALLASNFDDLQSMVSRVNEVAKSVGFSINAGKTNVFSSCIPVQEKAPLKVGGCQLKDVDSLKYLGARLLPNGQSKDGIVFRIDTARRVFSILRKCLWTRRDISIGTKIRIYLVSIRSVLLYGCECWATRAEYERKLEAFDHHCLGTIIRVKYTDFASN
ncbi:unnamed protein product [Schistocephalus solidus]|uniref:Conserved oligomeric Golgi complex subunit 7 n=1 Tax=Schistocephalus solidus TaxID=70667 RepID=A0A183TMX4_SCHSO|nr:unnamed protein product [Schistocephalus solidus]